MPQLDALLTLNTSKTGIAERIHGPQRMICVVMEPEMLDTRRWRGVLGGTLGNHLYVNLSSDAMFEEKCEEIMGRVCELVPECALQQQEIVRLESNKISNGDHDDSDHHNLEVLHL